MNLIEHTAATRYRAGVGVERNIRGPTAMTMYTTDNPNRIGWVHLSDMHFEWTADAWNDFEKHSDSNQEFAGTSIQSKLFDAIGSDLDWLRDKENVVPRFIFITGDLSNGKDLKKWLDDPKRKYPSPLECSVRWCKALAHRLSLDPVKDRVFFVPGNHDVVWNSVSDELRELLKNCDGTGADAASALRNQVFPMILDHNEKKLDECLAHLELYRLALNATGFEDLVASPDLTYGCCIPVGDTDLLIAGLNTAWACTQETNDKSSLPCGIYQQIDRVMASKAWEHGRNGGESKRVRIALMHHPVGWLHPLERPSIHQLCVQNFEFLFRGHEHDDWVNPWHGAHIEVAAARFGADRKNWWQIGYNLVEVDTFSHTARVFQRRCRKVDTPYGYQFQEINRDGKSRASPEREPAWVVPIVPTSPSTPSYSSAEQMRQLGHGSDPYARIVPETRRGAVATVDIVQFSRLPSADQASAIEALWGRLLGSAKTVNVDLYLHFSPLSDGLQFAVELEKLDKARDLAYEILRDLAQSWNVPGVRLRFGLDVGHFLALADGGRSHIVIAGEAANRSRRMAYVAAHGRLVMDSMHQSLFEATDDAGERAILLGTSFPPANLITSSLRDDVPENSGASMRRLSAAWKRCCEAIIGLRREHLDIHELKNGSDFTDLCLGVGFGWWRGRDMRWHIGVANGQSSDNLLGLSEFNGQCALFDLAKRVEGDAWVFDEGESESVAYKLRGEVVHKPGMAMRSGDIEERIIAASFLEMGEYVDTCACILFAGGIARDESPRVSESAAISISQILRERIVPEIPLEAIASMHYIAI